MIGGQVVVIGGLTISINAQLCSLKSRMVYNHIWLQSAMITYANFVILHRERVNVDNTPKYNPTRLLVFMSTINFLSRYLIRWNSFKRRYNIISDLQRDLLSSKEVKIKTSSRYAVSYSNGHIELCVSELFHTATVCELE